MSSVIVIVIVVQVIERIQVKLCILHADKDFFGGLFLVLHFRHLEKLIEYGSESRNLVHFLITRQFIFPLMLLG